MVQAIRSFATAAFAFIFVRSNRESDKIGAYAVDYSEPTQEEVDAANSSCAELFSTGNWVPVNRRS
jgi:hypothetical protein